MKIKEKAFKRGEKIALKSSGKIINNYSSGKSYVLTDTKEIVSYQTKRNKDSIEDEHALLFEIETNSRKITERETIVEVLEGNKTILSENADLLTGSVWCKSTFEGRETIDLYLESDLEHISNEFYEIIVDSM